MFTRIALVMMALAMLAAAQKPATQTVKDSRGMCQITVPTGILAIPGLAQGPNQSYSVVVEHEVDQFKVMSPAELKEFHYEKAFENSATRLWVEKDAHAVSEGHRAWHVYVPTPKGRCHAGIGFKSTTADAQLKPIALSLVALKK